MSSNTVVLITGASTGFGRLAAEVLAARGYTVVATMRDVRGRNVAHSEALLALANQHEWALHVADLDVSQDASVEQSVQTILGRVGHIDVVINNAGIGAVGVAEGYTTQQFHDIFEVNVFGVARVNRAVLPSMRRQRGGLLIHVSSAAGRVALPGAAVYCASKYALEALADAYRFELSPFGIDSVLVEPGIHKTPILEKFIEPADAERVADYGAAAEYVARVKAVFEAASQAAETPGPDQVVDAIVKLIETPAGQRPFRTVPTAALQPLLEPYNAAAAQIRPIVAEIFNVPELNVLQRAASVES
jgi:NAD(P)-dependent dehydrogenase (short-subunit alcohol dehydrogenase family)